MQTQAQRTADGFLGALYQDALNRAVDAAGRTFWTAALSQGESRAQVAAAVLSSGEYRLDVVEFAYQHLLRRQADLAGLMYFSSRLSEGARDEQVFAVIMASTEYAAG